jgi:molybdopterin converting factor small subunit
MEIYFFASYRDVFSNESIEIRDCVLLKDIICYLYNKNKLNNIQNENLESFYENSIVLVNGMNSELVGGLNTIIVNEDKLSIFPIVCGG